MIDTKELRRKLGSDDLIDHVDIHANVKPVLSELLDRLEAAESDGLEQARLNGIRAERELALMARIERLEHALRAMTKGYKSVAYAQWPAEMHLANEVLRENT